MKAERAMTLSTLLWTQPFTAAAAAAAEMLTQALAPHLACSRNTATQQPRQQGVDSGNLTHWTSNTAIYSGFKRDCVVDALQSMQQTCSSTDGSAVSSSAAPRSQAGASSEAATPQLLTQHARTSAATCAAAPAAQLHTAQQALSDSWRLLPIRLHQGAG